MSFDIEKMKADGVSEHLIYLASVAPEVLLIRVARRLENDRLFQQFMGESAGEIEKIYPYAVAAGLMSEADRLWLVDEENEYLKKYYTITFNTDGGNEIEPMTVVIGQNKTLPTPEKSGSTFDYWFEEETGVIIDNPYIPEGDIVLKALWSSDDQMTQQ